MASRFRVSKYKNQTLKLPEKPLKVQFTLPNPPSGASNWIASSGYLTAYLSGVDQLSIGSTVYDTSSSSLLSIAANGLSDFQFNPFHDDILGLCTTSGQLRIFRLPIIPTEQQTLQVKSTETGQFVDWNFGEGHSFQSLAFHPIVDSMLATTELESQFSLYDFASGSNGLEAQIQRFNSGLKLKSFSFDYTGKTAALAGTDLEGNNNNNNNNNNSSFTIQLYDVRSNEATAKTKWDNVLGSAAEARVLFLDGASSTPYLLTSSIDQKKHRTVATWDARSLLRPVATCVDFQVSSNIFLPLHDADTGVVYFALKNGNFVSYFEVDQLISDGFDVSGSAQSIPFSIKGTTLASKKCLDVMKTEINRVLMLTSQHVYPVSFHVPRKTYYDFHSDLYPDIRSPNSKLTRKTFFYLSSTQLPENKMSLDPKTNAFIKLLQFDCDIGAKTTINSSTTPNTTKKINSNEQSNNSSFPNTDTSSASSSSKMISQESFESNATIDSTSDVISSTSNESKSAKPALKPKPKPKPEVLKKFSAPAKFKYLKGVVGSRETCLTNVQNICKNISPLCEPFKANEKFGLFPLGTGVGGGCNQVAIVDLNRPQRLSGGVQSHLLCSDVVTDFQLDPFRVNRVAVGLQSGVVLIFSIYVDEDDVNLNADSVIIEQYDARLVGHNGRVTSVQFHPLANDVLATCGTDNRVLVWNVANEEEILYTIDLSAEESQIFSISWSSYKWGGTYLSVLGRSQQLYIFNVQTQSVVQKGKLPYKVNNGRVAWIANDQLILVTGFNGLSERQFYLFNPDDLSSGPLVEHGLDVSPSVLVPIFDNDTRTLFLTGKGDATIYTFEIADITSNPAPTNLITQLSHFEAPTPHQAVALLSKNKCDVKKLEFARGYRLTSNSIEPISFVVPRLNMEYFHDDLFPSTNVTWSPLFSASEWIDLSTMSPDSIPVPEQISLKPQDMQNYSEVKDQIAQEKLEKSQSNRSIAFGNNNGVGNGNLFDNIDESAFMHNFSTMVQIGKEKQELLVQQISGKVEFNSAKTALETIEGVDPDEWDD